MALSKLYYFCFKKKQINCFIYAKVIKTKYLVAEERNHIIKKRNHTFKA